MDDRAVSTVQTVLAETRWLPVPCPTEYLPALARDVLWALEQAGIEMVELPDADENGEWAGTDWFVWFSRGGSMQVREPGYMSHPIKARQFAAALLAAAVAAESVSVVATPQEQPRDADGNPICSECSMPEPSEWCWQQSVSCPFGKPPRSKP